MSHSFFLGLCDLQAGCLHSKCHVKSRLKQDYLFLFSTQDQSTVHIVWKSHLKQLSSITFSNNCQEHAVAFEVEGITYRKTWPWTYSHGPLISMHGSSGRMQVPLRVESKLLNSSISQSGARYCQLIRHPATGISEKGPVPSMPGCSLLLHFGLYALASTYPEGMAVQLCSSPKPSSLTRQWMFSSIGWPCEKPATTACWLRLLCLHPGEQACRTAC